MPKEVGGIDRPHVESIIRSATHAPSIHNSQPWRFVARLQPSGDSADVELYADLSLALPAIDPEHRELYISCGAALELARVQARSQGLQAEVAVTAAGSPSDPIATVTFRPGPAPSREELDLAAAIPARYTERSRFSDEPISEADLESLRALACPAGTWMKFVDPKDQVDLQVLLARADDIERADPAYEEEMALWHRTGPSPDGVPDSALGDAPVSERASSLRLRDFAPGQPSPANQASEPGLPPPGEHPLAAVIGTVGDDTASWLEAGEALGRLLLFAVTRGIAASPMTQVLEIPAIRAQFADAAGVLGHPQMLLRLGYASGHGSTSRRPLSDVLEFVDTGAASET